ncbi:MAG TPA: DUF3341 domain-containing protein [Candidatus Polarisedimenticolia bacterium]|nr:DUF3341 domain-containing protein [Candidatus Polarisedimenticolia bacterium]
MPRAETPLYGLMAEFADATSIVAAARRAHAEGYRRIDGYSPFPIEELGEALGTRTRGRLPKIVFAGGLLGCAAGFGLQYWCSAVDYPLNIGGKPLNSWPSFIPITFELTILFASLAAVLGMLGLNGLPRPYHPVFNVPEFRLASRDRFFLCIEASDPKFDASATRLFLESLTPGQVYEVAS